MVLRGSLPRGGPGPLVSRDEAGTDWRARWSAGATLGTVLPQIVLSQLVLIELSKFISHGSPEAGRQRHQLAVLSFSQFLSEREAEKERSSEVRPS